MNLASVIERSRRERENWRYTDLKALLPAPEPAGKPAAAPACHAPATRFQHRLVFIDGVFDSAQSQFSDLPPDILQGDAATGYKISLAGQTCLVTTPVELLFITTGAREVNGKFAIELGANGRLTLIERHVMPERAAAQVLETGVTLHPQAKFVHGKIVEGGAASAHIAETKVRVAHGAYYDNFTLIRGGGLVRNEIDVTLAGELAQCNLNGAMLLRGRDHADTWTRITHAAPHGASREIYKSVVAGQARGVFQGKIVVEPGAQKTDGHQLSRALLLSDQAEMDAKPELEIYADDVKCSHGAAVGELDEDALFYLRARGLNEAAARALLIEGFIGEILDEIHAPELRAACQTQVEEWLHEQN